MMRKLPIQPVRTLLYVIILLGITTCLGSQPDWLRKVRIGFKGKTASLEELDQDARWYANHKKNQVIPAGLESTFEVLPKGKTFVSVYYGSDAAGPYWRICFDKRGEIICFISGVSKGD
jgi:hypothetical protein